MESLVRCSAKVWDSKFTEPVWVDTLTGGIFELPQEKIGVEGEKVTFKDIPVYDAPTFIAEKSLVMQGTK
jgi:hypothetical protein